MVTVTGIAPGASGVADGGECTSGAADRTRNGSLRVAAVFSDHMVLQRETPVAVFGTAPAGGRVVVDLMDDQGVTVAQTMAVAQAYGEHETETPWLAILPALPASGPYTLRVSHETNRLEFADVMIGEVWLAGGQSNMELELHTSEHGDEAIAAAADPLLRFYNTPKAGRIDESAEAASGWEPAVAPQVAGMSAIAYHFGARLRAELGANVAVGIIDCYIGGTSITSWMSRATLIGSDARHHARGGRRERRARRRRIRVRSRRRGRRVCGRGRADPARRRRACDRARRGTAGRLPHRRAVCVEELGPGAAVQRRRTAGATRNKNEGRCQNGYFALRVLRSSHASIADLVYNAPCAVSMTGFGKSTIFGNIRARCRVTPANRAISAYPTTSGYRGS